MQQQTPSRGYVVHCGLVPPARMERNHIVARKQRSAWWRTPSGERCRNDFFGNPRGASLARQLACGRDRSTRRSAGLRTHREEVRRASTHKRIQKRRNNSAFLRGHQASSRLGTDVGRPAQCSSLSSLRGTTEAAPSGTFADWQGGVSNELSTCPRDSTVPD